MKKDNIAKIAIFLILITCLTGVVSASEDATNHTVAASDDSTMDKVVSDADSNDAPTTTTVDKNLKSVDDSDKTPVTQDKKQVDDIDDSTVNDENDQNSGEFPEKGNGNTRSIHYISDESDYNQYITSSGLNGNPGDTYSFTNSFTGKSICINLDNTTITSSPGVVLTNCGFLINPNIHGVTITGLTISNTIGSCPIYVGPNCSDISIDHNDIYVDYSFVNGTYLYGIDFNAWSNTAYNFHNININDNTIRMYGNSYICGIYGSDFIDSNVLRNNIYVYSDTGSNSAGNNAVYGISLCDDSQWATISRPINNTIAYNNVTVIGQCAYGIEDFGINQAISNNNITATANTTGSAYGIAVGRFDNSTINTNTIYITAGNLTQIITTDMIHGSNAGIRLHSDPIWNYSCNNVSIEDCTIYYNDFVESFARYYSPVQNDSGNTNIEASVDDDSYYDSNPYAPTYPNNVPQNRVSKSNAKTILRAINSPSTLRDIDTSTIYVDSNTGDDDYDGTESNPVRSIATALNKVSSGGTIILNEGTYTGSITITKSVSIRGTNREKTIINFPSDTNVIKSNYGSGNFF